LSTPTPPPPSPKVDRFFQALKIVNLAIGIYTALDRYGFLAWLDRVLNGRKS